MDCLLLHDLHLSEMREYENSLKLTISDLAQMNRDCYFIKIVNVKALVINLIDRFSTNFD